MTIRCKFCGQEVKSHGKEVARELLLAYTPNELRRMKGTSSGSNSDNDEA